jgi:4-carboxymuconolactone decarboxylase
MQMTYLAAAIASLSLIAVSPARADDPPSNDQFSAPRISDLGTVSPALERFTRDALFDGLWHRPELSPL